jgi:hypothetical protein
VRTKILDSRHATFGIFVKNHGLVADLAAQGLVGDLMRLTGHIPSVFEKHVDPYFSVDRA